MMRPALLHIVIPALLALPMSADGQTAPPSPPAKAPTTTTIVGCLVQGNPNDTSGSSAKDFFVRTPTVALPVGSTVAVGTPGTTSTATSSGTPTRDSLYRITGLDVEQLRPHIGHRVEIQGQLSSRMPDAAAGGVTTQGKTRVDKDGKPIVTVETRVDVAGDFRATTIKMVSATCP